MSHTRTVYINGEVANALDTFWVLFWMSMSYGITNFAFIWTALSKDKYTKYWIFLICMWWMIAPSIADMGEKQLFKPREQQVLIMDGWE